MTSGPAGTAYALARPGVRQRVPVARFLHEYGPFVLAAYMLATARWGSYLLPGPPYIGDLFLSCVIGERVIAAMRNRTAVSLATVELTLGCSCALLLAWSSLRFLVGSISLNSIRDFAPYAYAILVFLTPYRGFIDARRAKMEKALFAALLFHGAWMTVSMTSKSFVASLPVLGGGQSRFLELRPDVDSTICGVLVVYGLYRVIAGRRPLLSLAIVGWQLALVFGDYSRAALAGCIVQIIAFVLLTPAPRQLLRRYGARILVPLLILLIPGAIYEGSKSGPVNRLSQAGSSFVPLVPTTGDPTDGATATARARRLAWQAIEIYLEAKPSRDWAGVGFGPDFLHDSGADLLLLGGTFEDVRSPHNYLINTWARLGLIGLIMIMGIGLCAVRIAVKVGRSPDLDGLDVAAIAVAAGLSVAACYGVVLESPFGALPVWWALGYLGSRAVSVGVSWPMRRS